MVLCDFLVSKRRNSSAHRIT